MRFGIDRYIGDWTSDDGLRLHIAKLGATHARVSICNADDIPVCRPYWDGKPMIGMPADYDDYSGAFIVHLWEPGLGFSLHLEHHSPGQWVYADEEVLSPAISQNEEDAFLDPFKSLLGKLRDYKRMKTQNQPIHATR